MSVVKTRVTHLLLTRKNIPRDTTTMLTAMKKQNQDMISLNIRRKTSFQKEKQ